MKFILCASYLNFITTHAVTWNVPIPVALRGLRRGSAAACLLGLRVRIPPGKWMSLSCECCVLSGRGLCLGLIIRPDESYRVSCVLWAWSRSPVRGGHDAQSDRRATGKKSNVFICQHVALTTLFLTEITNKRKLILFTWTCYLHVIVL